MVICLRASKGPLAHSVERFHGMEEASGSNPLGSTKSLSVSARNDYLEVSKLHCDQKHSGGLFLRIRSPIELNYE